MKYNGLSAKEVEENTEKYGKNKLPEKPPVSNLKIFLYQLKNPLVFVLLFAGIVSIALGDVSDSVVIFAAVAINTILGFLQESKAEKALESLKKLVHPQAKVVRDGKIIHIDVENVVVGDVVVVSAGDKTPADGIVLQSNRLSVDESMLTGESFPIEKNKDADVYMGTVVVGGNGYVRVEKIGLMTKMGEIAKSLTEESEDTPLTKQLKKFSKQLTYLVIVLISFVFVIGLLRGMGVVELFKTSVALAVSSIPEGLLVGLTVVLAIGMQRILRNKGLVRNLVSAETLGGVSVICVDKTGTLTQGKMQVVDVVGEGGRLAKQIIIANDSDDPIVLAGEKWAKSYLEKEQLKEISDQKYNRVDSIPFNSKDRFFASLNKSSDGKRTLYVNGAPEFLLSWTKMSKKEKIRVEKQIEDFASEGKRVIGLAQKSVEKDKDHITAKDVKKDLEWVGMLAFSDLVREGVAGALERTRRAGIKTIVITGDYPQTAIYVMKQLGMEVSDECVMLGSELAKISSAKLSEKLRKQEGVKLFARTTPQQKQKIVEALKRNGDSVAMMGDGVNDAPALKMADIGIVVGEATDVAKESSDLVLLDSSFATIVSAVEGGREIFDNIRKVILYLMSDAFGEIIAVIGTIMMGIPLPVTATQILWINLVSDGFPHLALTVDPRRKFIMDDKPRRKNEGLVSGWMIRLIFIVSLFSGLSALFLFNHFLPILGVDKARSIAFAALGSNSLIYVYSIKTLRESFWQENPFDNKWLNIAVFGGIFLQIIPFVLPVLGNFLQVEQISFSNWSIVVAMSFSMFCLIEIVKLSFRLSKKT